MRTGAALTPDDTPPCYHMTNPGPRESAPPDVTNGLSLSVFRRGERA